MGTLSSVIVALALVAQVSETGAAFFAFALVLLPVVFFLGVTTFKRILQSTLEFGTYARSINRIRRYYLEQAPHLADYFIIPATDDPDETLAAMSIRRTWWQPLLTMAGTIAVIDSAVAAVFLALVVVAVGGPVIAIAIAAAAGFIGCAALFFRHQTLAFRRASQVSDGRRIE